MRIALDAMGGDFAPAPNVDGAIAALQENPDLQIFLVGDIPTLEPLVRATGYSGDRLELCAAEGWVGMEEKPVEALRRKPNCSIVVCWQLMAERRVDAVVSAGHTGAVVAASLRSRLFLPHVKRPGIAAPIPTVKGSCILMDVGANPAARPEHLYQYGVMGSIFARATLGIEKPRIGLMNIGSEDGKGNELVKEAHALFARSHLRDLYIGNVEGRDLYEGTTDVVICEGFLGNVLLKAAEGMADMIVRAASQEVMSHLVTEQHLARKAFEKLDKRYQYHESGGAPLLGIDGISIICHGSSNQRSIYNALKVATRLKACGVNEQIAEQLALGEP